MLEMLTFFGQQHPRYSPVEARRVSRKFGTWQIVAEDAQGGRATFTWNQNTKGFYQPPF